MNSNILTKTGSLKLDITAMGKFSIWAQSGQLCLAELSSQLLPSDNGSCHFSKHNCITGNNKPQFVSLF